MSFRKIRIVAAILVSTLVCATTSAAEGWPESLRDRNGWPADNTQQLPMPAMASCEFVNGYCQISIHDPIARRIPSTQVLQNGPRSGLVTPQAYAEAYAGRPVTIIKMSFVPSGNRMRAVIEWQ